MALFSFLPLNTVAGRPAIRPSSEYLYTGIVPVVPLAVTWREVERSITPRRGQDGGEVHMLIRSVKMLTPG